MLTVQMRRLVLAALLFWFLATPAMSMSAAESVPENGLFRKGNVLLSFTLWQVGTDQLACVYSQPLTYKADSDNEKDHIQFLDVFKRVDKEWQRIYSEEVVVPISAIYSPWPESDRLFVISQGGSTYSLRIFAYAAGKLSKVFEDGTKFQPEIVYGKGLSEYLLIARFGLVHSRTGTVTQTPTRADIFRWTGKEYVRVGTASWAERLSSVPE